MSKLIIVSNRLPITVSQPESDPEGNFIFAPSSGGLATALRSVHSDDSLWIGHSGLFLKKPADRAKLDGLLAAQNLRAVTLKEDIYQRYYLGMSNAVFWPLFHYFPQSMKLDLRDWAAYQEVNKVFAAEILKYTSAGDRVWVQDYQLMLLPALLREADPTLNIAYFHHVPFPSSEIFRVLPMRADILRGLLGADLVGFHTYDYTRHFISSASAILGKDVYVEEVTHQGRTVKVGTFPIGIDAKDWQTVSRQAVQQEERLREQFGECFVFLGVDRLDYTKGILERLQAYQLFLRRYPVAVGKVVLVQVCVPSRTKVKSYDSLRKSVERMVGEIAGEFGRPGYAPVHYVYRSIPQTEVAALYRLADLMLVTPLRDGLNLVCKEFVAANEKPGAMLMLSEFAGAAAEMGEAVIVNPYDIEGVALAMISAMGMPVAERVARMKALRERVVEHDCHAWANEFLEHWTAVNVTHRRKPLLTKPKIDDLHLKIAAARHVYIFTDYDGTLVPIVSRPEQALPTKEVQTLLSRFNSIKKASLFVITGRSRGFCEEHFISKYPKMTLAAEHGLFIYDNAEWRQRAGAEDIEKIRSELMYILRLHTRNVPGSEIEVKESSVVWHYRNANQRFAQARVRILKAELRSLLADTTLSVVSGNKILEIKPALANKGHAIESILEQKAFDPKMDLLLTIGDDTTDEDMFRALSPHNASICVGRALTSAKTYIQSQSEVIQLLHDIGDRCN